MPELPEVEIVKQSLSKKIEHKKIKKIIITNRNLRFKIPIFNNRSVHKVFLSLKEMLCMLQIS